MVIKEFKFKDFLGIERKEEHRFHLSYQELMTMELGAVGGFTTLLKKLSDKLDVPELEKILRVFIDKSYGVMSPDGRRFDKSPEILADFKATPMYSDLYMELLSDSDKAWKFIEGILPTMTEEQKKQFSKALEQQGFSNNA